MYITELLRALDCVVVASPEPQFLRQTRHAMPHPWARASVSLRPSTQAGTRTSSVQHDGLYPKIEGLRAVVLSTLEVQVPTVAAYSL